VKDGLMAKIDLQHLGTTAERCLTPIPGLGSLRAKPWVSCRSCLAKTAIIMLCA